MIIKNFNLNKSLFKKKKFYLIYGNNYGLIKDIIDENLIKNLSGTIIKYDEDYILKNLENFKEDILNQSFFDKEKIFIISRTSDKIIGIIEETISKNLIDIKFILIANNLEKRSKLRNYFEKNDNTICIPVYEDSHQSLGLIVNNFIRAKKIRISQHDINFIIERSGNDRLKLKNELKKIEFFLMNKKTITTKDLSKLMPLSENQDIYPLIDNSLSKNKMKTFKILNENNFASDECIIILRTLLSRLKRILKLKLKLSNKISIEEIINSYKPTIFWKEKEIVKKQIKIWDTNHIKELIIKTNEIEGQVKKNPQMSINYTTDFIINISN